MLVVKMKWNPYKEEWMATDKDGYMLERFEDCKWTNHLFQDLDKDLDNHYEISPFKRILRLTQEDL